MVKMYAKKLVNGKVCGHKIYLWRVSRQDAARLARAGILYTNVGTYADISFA